MLEETCASPPKAGRQRGGQRTPQGRGEKSGCETRPARTARQAPLAWVAVCSNRTTGEERSSRRGRGFPWGPRRHEEEDKEEKEEEEDEEDVAGGERTRREGGDVHQRARPRRPHASEWPALHARGNWHRGGSHAAQAQRQARRSAQISLWQGI
ncbi:unnamed protein product [Prorocentrum cordatum]|uniref:Uncharacterized protein n=1 Tax=Prorocentrum cordatum TaxID=2364126 RepID=A0ABN9UKI7_9DINO|nr:unnamed protein product [Polarella glacialis]